MTFHGNYSVPTLISTATMYMSIWDVKMVIYTCNIHITATMHLCTFHSHAKVPGA